MRLELLPTWELGSVYWVKLVVQRGSGVEGVEVHPTGDTQGGVVVGIGGEAAIAVGLVSVELLFLVNTLSN